MLKWLKKLFRLEPKCTCKKFRADGHLRPIEQAFLDDNCPLHGVIASLKVGACPDCRGGFFNFGPEGGVGRVASCEQCGSPFLVEVLTDMNEETIKVIPWGRA